MYTHRFDDFTVDMLPRTCCINDSLLWNLNTEQSCWHTVEYIKDCAINGLVFNPLKFEFGKDVVDFAGFTVTEDRFKPTHD